MKDVQSDSKTFASRRPVCRIFRTWQNLLNKAAIIVGVVLPTLGLLCGAAYSQYPMTPYDTPSTNPYGHSGYGYAGYNNAGYGYAVPPVQGLYYSGHSPMLQPAVTMPHYGAYPNPAYNMGLGQYPNEGQQNENHSEYANPPQVTRPPTGSAYSQYMPLRSPLLETGWETAKLLSPLNAPDGPHRGVGTPLEDQSWLDRPWYAGVFGGWAGGSKLIHGEIGQGSGSNGGVLLGKNLNHYWGMEGRFFGSSMNIKDISDSPFPTPERSCRLTVLDLSVHYYPYGEARWRPYFKLGIGYAQQSFTGNYSESYNINTCTVPFGAGLKYWWSDRVNVFGEVVDNMILGKGPTQTQSNWALHFGVNFTFGSNPNHHPTVYWPQSPAY